MNCNGLAFLAGGWLPEAPILDRLTVYTLEIPLVAKLWPVASVQLERTDKDGRTKEQEGGFGGGIASRGGADARGRVRR